jgi:hypothetical protein
VEPVEVTPFPHQHPSPHMGTLWEISILRRTYHRTVQSQVAAAMDTTLNNNISSTFLGATRTEVLQRRPVGRDPGTTRNDSVAA